MIVTRQWLLDNRSPRGGWTRGQLAAIGVRWPPRHGWMRRVIGRGINDEQAMRFERSRGTNPPVAVELDLALLAELRERGE